MESLAQHEMMVVDEDEAKKKTDKLKWLNHNEPIVKTELYKRDLKLGWHAVLHRDAGLKNMGNTCFLNATIQALFHIPSFIDFLSAEYEHTRKCLNSLQCLTCALYRTWLNLKLHPVTIPMSILLLLPKLGGALVRGQQNDAHEFLRGLLNGIEAEMLAQHPPVDYCSQQTTAIGKIFGAWLCNTLKCNFCKTESVTYFAQLDIFVESDQVSSLQDAVNNFLEPEVLDGNTCKVCGRNQMTKQVKYWSYPKVLQIVIKRFEFETQAKLNWRVSINKSLQLGKTHTYKFLSAVIHHGSSMDSGHYTCTAACPNQLISFNDSQIASLDESFLEQKELTEGAYIIFYELHKVVKEDEHQEAKPITPNIQEPTKKRDLPKSPTKKSPLQKIMAAASPSSLFPTMTKSLLKFGSNIKIRFDCLNNDSDNMSDHSYSKKLLDTDDSSEKSNEKRIPPIKISVHTRESPKPSESLHSYRIADATSNNKQTNERVVSPLTITRRVRDNPKPSESLHSYGIADKTAKNQITDKRVSPVKITIRSRENRKPSESVHSYKIADKLTINNSIQRTEKTVPPIVIQKRRREDPKPSESLHSYKIMDGQEKDNQSSTDRSMIKNNSDMGMTRAGQIRNSLLKIMESTRDLSLQPCSDEKVTDETAEINMDKQDFEADVFGNESPGSVPTHIKYFPVLAANVSGTKLPKENIGDNLVADLTTWLRARGIPTSRLTKNTLVDLVAACKDIGREHILDPSQAINSQNIASAVEIQIPTTGWDTFPSREIPLNFNFGSVYHYMVETMPVYEGDDPDSMLAPNSSDEEDERVMHNVNNDCNLHDPFDNCERDEMLQNKKMRKGLSYVASKFVRIIEDCIDGRVHFFKAHVRASFRKKAYWVDVGISQISGRVVFCLCDTKCVQKALGRCNHVSSTLLAILIHTRLNGYQAITCTSRPCEWNKGSLVHDPEVANERQYDSFKIDIIRRATFDPRPTKYQKERPNQLDINNFLAGLSYKDCHWSLLLKIIYEDGDYTDHDLNVFYPELRQTFYENMQDLIEKCKPSETYVGPVEIKATRRQSKSKLWHRLQSLHCSASTCKKVMHFTTESAIKNFLRNQMWKMNKVRTKAMTHGINNEAKARAAYLKRLQEREDPDIEIIETGLYLHTNHQGLSCSPDGIIRSFYSTRVLEIKCPYTLKDHKPQDFEEVIKKKNLKSYFLQKNNLGEIVLLPKNDFYYQVQMVMGLTELKKCDFVVWTEHDMIDFQVPFNPDIWEQIKNGLQTFHWKYVAPEYFLMRTVRDLPPLAIN